MLPQSLAGQKPEVFFSGLKPQPMAFLWAALVCIAITTPGFCSDSGLKSLRRHDITAPSPATPQDLPYAKGMDFETLDSYLAYRRKLGAIDIPYYREISPGVYQLIVGRQPKSIPAKIYTRQQLLELFGFKK
jgi:hypothetical protein